MDDERIDWAEIKRHDEEIERMFRDMPTVGPISDGCPAVYPHHHHSDNATCVPPRPSEEWLRANDGTVWMYSPELGIWTGWEPGEEGVWTMQPEDFARFYPEC